jgi:hypothetical protein
MIKGPGVKLWKAQVEVDTLLKWSRPANTSLTGSFLHLRPIQAKLLKKEQVNL